MDFCSGQLPPDEFLEAHKCEDAFPFRHNPGQPPASFNERYNDLCSESISSDSDSAQLLPFTTVFTHIQTFSLGPCQTACASMIFVGLTARALSPVDLEQHNPRQRCEPFTLFPKSLYIFSQHHGFISLFGTLQREHCLRWLRLAHCGSPLPRLFIAMITIQRQTALPAVYAEGECWSTKSL